MTLVVTSNLYLTSSRFGFPIPCEEEWVTVGWSRHPKLSSACLQTSSVMALTILTYAQRSPRLQRKPNSFTTLVSSGYTRKFSFSCFFLLFLESSFSAVAVQLQLNYINRKHNDHQSTTYPVTLPYVSYFATSQLRANGKHWSSFRFAFKSNQNRCLKLTF